MNINKELKRLQIYFFQHVSQYDSWNACHSIVCSVQTIDAVNSDDSILFLLHFIEIIVVKNSNFGKERDSQRLSLLNEIFLRNVVALKKINPLRWYLSFIIHQVQILWIKLYEFLIGLPNLIFWRAIVLFNKI